ncbi:hypothetical protein BT96DRAFT_964408 [Gymnopus androsaceus JB14]|uniref:Amidohydrolase 3 domain-containing protein n=1 Tax=Gymnopus androsaceus JB14 TaxID=1447944 RepID=A0A6A4I4N3_9AGAR|nr:hypothetical protein BT96DRAFT_964408 [Gymnopus androsaceus JB14]
MSKTIIKALLKSSFFSCCDAFTVASLNEYTICSKSGSIYTVDETKPQVECISIKGTRISDTGSLRELESRKSPAPWLQTWFLTRLFGPPRVSYVHSNSIVIPGLADAHAHIIDNGFKMQLELDTCKTIAEVLDRVKAYIVSHPDIYNNNSRWIEGMGWDQTKWPEKRFPTAADLDADPLLRGRPIALARVDVHATWVSGRVLELMGELPTDVEGGLIIRDSNGDPTGVFVDNAMTLIPRPEWTDKQLAQFFDATMKSALSYGLTSIHDADSSPRMINFMKNLADAGEIPMRLYLMGNVVSDEYWGSQIPRLDHYGKHGRLTVRSIKLFTDGALGSWGAALLEPYSDKPDTTGIMRSTPKALSDLVKQFWKDGWQVCIHCIGDRANHVVLDVFQDLIEGNNADGVKANITEWRPRIEHAQIMTKEDLERAGRLGVIASVQPTHATSDMWYAETRLGPERIKGAYAYQTLLRESPNRVLALGSDFPVEGVNPLLGFYAAVSRLSVDGSSPHGDQGWYISEALSRAQALKGMTLDPAYASFVEHELGSLTPGKIADFVVLDRDIMKVPYAEILEAKVVATVIDGKTAYGSL